jgi:hypothetical protein
MVVTSPSSLARSSSESNAPPVTAQSLAGRCHRSASRCCLQDERRTMSGGAAALLLYWQQERPSPNPVGASGLREYWSG